MMPNIEGILKQALETLAVTNAIQDRHARMLVDHEKWMEENTLALARHREWLEQHEAAMHEHQTSMRELDAKLDRLAELILKGRGGNGDAT